MNTKELAIDRIQAVRIITIFQPPSNRCSNKPAQKSAEKKMTAYLEISRFWLLKHQNIPIHRRFFRFAIFRYNPNHSPIF